MTYLTEFLVVAVCFLKSINMAFSQSEFVIDNCLPENHKTWTCNYIPQSIPPGYSNVRIVNFGNVYKAVVLNSTTFKHKSWTNVESLEMKDDVSVPLLESHFEANCFTGLDSLQELKINVDRYFLDSNDTFSGIPTLKILDLSGSVRLTIDTLQQQLIRPENIPQLNTLILRRLGTTVSYEEHLNWSFFRALGTRYITHLDIGEMKISDLNLTALVTELPFVKRLNVSYSHVEQFITNYTTMDLSRIELVDFSFTWFPTYFFNVGPGKTEHSNEVIEISPKTYQRLRKVIASKVMNISGFFGEANADKTFWYRNVSLVAQEEVQSVSQAMQFNFTTRSLVCRKNGFKYLDVQVMLRGDSFDSLIDLDFSSNGLEMLHPSILAFAPNLEVVNLSENEIGMMFSNLVEISSRLFANLVHLRIINLSDNKIRIVPKNLFAQNTKLEMIDLSKNKLEQIYFSISNVDNLRFLNLSQNNIHILDEISLNNLNNILCGLVPCHRLSERKTTVDFNSNPLACSTCESKQYVEWLIQTKSINIIPQYMFCKNRNEMLVPIDKCALTNIRDICREPTVIMSSCLSAALFVLFAILTAILIYSHKKKLNRKKNRLNVIEKLHEGEGQFEFAVFVSFSSNDFDFVSENVLKPLNANLQLITGVERNLVCTGDLGFRPGFHLHDEVARCRHRSSVFLAVLSESFCVSDFCQSEFDQAIVHQKPIVLMLKHHVDERNMSPAMQVLFKRNARILWIEENGHFFIQPSWEDICVAILDKIKLDS